VVALPPIEECIVASDGGAEVIRASHCHDA
jgi:hypothetical protein